MRDAHLREHPLCLMCLGDDNRPVPAKVVDHIKPWQRATTPQERDQLFSDPTNLQSLCVAHHNAKTGGERGRGW
jgi:5-methylcytosine-specific restriction endonuclease McrA